MDQAKSAGNAPRKDYYTNYPVTLPLRRPYSGNPELLDEEEFGDDAERLQYDEYESNSTVDLGLMGDELEKRMLFLQLPANMPISKQSSNKEGQNQDNNLINSGKGERSSQKSCCLEALPAGFMGKMLVYKSGAIKLKLGDALFDVSAGLDCAFAQDVVAINTEKKHCCNLGELNQRAVLTPDIDSILENVCLNDFWGLRDECFMRFKHRDWCTGHMGFLHSWCFDRYPGGNKRKSLAPLVFFGTTGTMLDIIMGISACEREHAERQMKLLEAQNAENAGAET
ncbi:hypothetical protein F511_27091 [Dorcoceras hygrometricum]|uniref:DNA-directed RNA polymerase III subunit RPC4 n=1 Tax=Dorcoceras hygrometricum TaxID=472368 RepID=A0A2Z7AIR5_9LAMI|nr:hypothetical protein F511_27091 [Dorcoceras hygrometricum]